MMVVHGPVVPYMLNSVCHSRHAVFVTEVSDIDIEGRAGLVCLRIMNKKSLKLIVKPNYTVIAIV